MKFTSYFFLALVSLFLLTVNTNVNAQDATKENTVNASGPDLGAGCVQWTGNCNTTDAINRNGIVGIGMIPNPAYHLSVFTNTPDESGGGTGGAIYARGDFAIHGVAYSTGGGFGSVAIRGEGGSGGTGGWFSGGAYAGRFDGSVRVSGNVTVVNGKLMAPRIEVSELLYSKEVRVKLPPFPDYVFEKSYTLMPLKVLEEYINANKRLPNMPSAEEVEADGGNIGELQVKQMEKIEELTLYILEMNKRLEKLEAENKLLKEQVEELKK